jgi:hypothetical protein
MSDFRTKDTTLFSLKTGAVNRTLLLLMLAGLFWVAACGGGEAYEAPTYYPARPYYYNPPSYYHQYPEEYDPQFWNQWQDRQGAG